MTIIIFFNILNLEINMNKYIVDANSIVSEIVYKTTDFASVYPITPSSTMGENYSKFSEAGKKNIFDNIPQVREMQSETGTIACVHGASLSGSFSTTFTSSQGLLLMIPNLYKMANELLPFTIHVASRSLSSNALNIFCDHSDVMATQKTGLIMMCSSSVQSAQDFAMLSQMITLKSKIGVLHFFDGFRTSHEINTINKLSEENIKNLFPYNEYLEFKNQSISNVNPVVLGTNQNSDIFFQTRERINEYLEKIPEILKSCFYDFYKETKRSYSAFEYYGNKNASKILVVMGSAFEPCKEIAENSSDYGVIKVNVFSPFLKEEFLSALPKSAKIVTVLDRTKENNSLYEPLCMNVIACLKETDIRVLGGRFGLGGKDFDKNMAYACFKNMENELKDHFTIGIEDDLTLSSLKVEKKFTENDAFSSIFFGLGSDGMVTATKNTLKIIGDNTDLFVQGYFNYDSRKSGSLTASEMLISKDIISHPYQVLNADFVIINNIEFLNKFHKESFVKKGGKILVNSPNNLNETLNDEVKKYISENNIEIYSIDANALAIKYNLGTKINLVMQTAFFNLTNFLEFEKALNRIKEEAKKSFQNKSATLVENCFKACDEVKKMIIKHKNFNFENTINNDETTNFIEAIANFKGNELSVKTFKASGKFEENYTTTPFTFSKNSAEWIKEKCIQCGGCEMVCPHNAIKCILTKEKDIENLPIDTIPVKNKDGFYYSVFINKNKCTGCSTCVLSCPTRAIKICEKNVTLKDKEISNIVENFENEKLYEKNSLKDLSFNKSYYNFCSACSGCAQTQYYRLLSKLCGSHLILSNATGCSSIYNGSVDVCPFNKDKENLGTSFMNNLFEDTIEFGYGANIGFNLARTNFKNFILNNISSYEQELQKLLSDLIENFENFAFCKEIYSKLKNYDNLPTEIFNNLKFVMPVVHFIVGGDGFSYDIDFGGLDHVIASGENVKILIFDNEVYSNTGGQTSKATNLGALTKYTNKKQTLKKDLFLSLMQYKDLYFARVCLGADKNQALKAFNEALSHNGPSLILAYTPCLNHGIDMSNVYNIQKNAVKSGYFNLMRYNETNKQFNLDSIPDFHFLESFLKNENRYKNLDDALLNKLIASKIENYELYKKLQNILFN